MDPNGTQKQLDAAIAPVAGRLLKRYKATQQDKVVAENKYDDKAIRVAKDQLEALLLFKTSVENK